MHIYEVYNHQGLQGTVTVHGDGRKTWKIGPEWQEFWLTKEHQTAIETAIDIWRNRDELTLSGFTIRRRREPAE